MSGINADDEKDHSDCMRKERDTLAFWTVFRLLRWSPVKALMSVFYLMLP